MSCRGEKASKEKSKAIKKTKKKTRKRKNEKSALTAEGAGICGSDKSRRLRVRGCRGMGLWLLTNVHTSCMYLLCALLLLRRACVCVFLCVWQMGKKADLVKKGVGRGGRGSAARSRCLGREGGAFEWLFPVPHAWFCA